MAHKKQAGSVKNNRDSVSKRLGVKVFGSQTINSGEIILRQRGTKFHPGVNVKRTGDDTLIATTDGVVEFIKRKVRGFSGNLQKRTFVAVLPAQETKPTVKPSAKNAAANAKPAKDTTSAKKPAPKKAKETAKETIKA